MFFHCWKSRFVEEIKQFSFQHRFRKWDTLNGENHKARFGMSIASLGNVNLDGKDGESPGGYQGEWVGSTDQAYLERSSRTVTCGDGIVMQEMSWRDDVYLWEWPNIAGHHWQHCSSHICPAKTFQVMFKIQQWYRQIFEQENCTDILVGPVKEILSLAAFLFSFPKH